MLWLLACATAPRFTDPAALLLRELDADGSGALDARELPARDPARELARLDADASGAVELGELRAAMDGWGTGAGPPTRPR